MLKTCVHLIVMYNTLHKMTLLGGEQNLSIIQIQVYTIIVKFVYMYFDAECI